MWCENLQILIIDNQIFSIFFNPYIFIFQLSLHFKYRFYSRIQFWIPEVTLIAEQCKRIRIRNTGPGNYVPPQNLYCSLYRIILL